MSFRNQFALPHGAGGRLAGWIMGTRRSNVSRNRWVVDLLELEPGETVLEIGCGPGVAIARAVDAGARVVAVDPSDVMRAMASRRNAAADGQVDIRPGSAADLPPGPFDAAFAVNTVMFWADVDRSLRAVAERLAPGGRVALAVQPRHKGASDDDAHRIAEENVGRLRRAGFVDLRVEVLPLRPTNAAAALGRKVS